MRKPVALALLLLSAACATRRIPGTDIADNDDTRAIIGVIKAYREAAERRDADAVLSLVSPKYFDDAGTTDPTDDMDYEQLKKALPEDYKNLRALKLDLTVKQVRVDGDSAIAEMFFDGHFRVATPKGDVAKSESDLHRMTFARDGKAWKVVAGL